MLLHSNENKEAKNWIIIIIENLIQQAYTMIQIQKMQKNKYLEHYGIRGIHKFNCFSGIPLQYYIWKI